MNSGSVSPKWISEATMLNHPYKEKRTGSIILPVREINERTQSSRQGMMSILMRRRQAVISQPIYCVQRIMVDNPWIIPVLLDGSRKLTAVILSSKWLPHDLASNVFFFPKK